MTDPVDRATGIFPTSDPKERPPGTLFLLPVSTPAPTTARATLAALRALAEPICERVGVELVAIELLGGAGTGHRIARFSIDRAGGVSADDCARVSRKLSPALDVADNLAGPYDLEVSSPGFERPVQREKDFAYFTGCTVRIKTFGMDGRRRIRGEILGAADGVVRVACDGAERTFAVDDIERANLVLDVDQYARMGEGLHPLAQPSGPARPAHGEST